MTAIVVGAGVCYQVELRELPLRGGHRRQRAANLSPSLLQFRLLQAELTPLALPALEIGLRRQFAPSGCE